MLGRFAKRGDQTLKESILGKSNHHNPFSNILFRYFSKMYYRKGLAKNSKFFSWTDRYNNKALNSFIAMPNSMPYAKYQRNSFVFRVLGNLGKFTSTVSLKQNMKHSARMNSTFLVVCYIM